MKRWNWSWDCICPEAMTDGLWEEFGKVWRYRLKEP
jgi:hypothetical protein